MRFAREQNHKGTRSFCRQGKGTRPNCEQTLRSDAPLPDEVQISIVPIKPLDGMRPPQSPSVRSQGQINLNLVVSSKEIS